MLGNTQHATRVPWRQYVVVGMLFLAGVLVRPAQAWFFARMGSGPSALVALKASGGALIYETDARINGRTAHLAILGFEMPSTQLAAIAATLAGNKPTPPEGAILEWTRADRRYRMLVLSASGERSIGILIDQNTSAGETTPTWPPGLPRPGGAQLIFSAEQDRGRSTIAVASVEQPHTAIEDVDRALTMDGWRRVAPHMDGGLALYARPRELCAVGIHRHREMAHITLLHKRTGEF